MFRCCATEQESRRLLATEWQTIYFASSNPEVGQLLFLRDATLLAQTFDARRRELTGEPVDELHVICPLQTPGLIWNARH
jgi:hypothetical protein